MIDTNIKAGQNFGDTFEEQELSRAINNKVQTLKNMVLPSNYINPYSGIMVPDIEFLDTYEAYNYCLRELGRVDIEYIAHITYKSHSAIITDLKGIIFQNPDKWQETFYKGYETREKYLSGNLTYKMNRAIEVGYSFDGYFNGNVQAIKSIMPPKVQFKDIYVTLGTPWLPDYVVNNFIRFLFNIDGAKNVWRTDIVRYENAIQEWVVDKPLILERSAINLTKFGTKRVGALEIIRRTLNHKPLSVYDVMDSPNEAGKTITVLNTRMTASLQEKRRLILEVFNTWLPKQAEAVSDIEDIYYSKFGSTITRQFNSEYIVLRESNPNITLYDYQKKAIARIIESDSTLLAHDVGSGKTYAMIGAGMEMHFMGISKRNMYVVPNNIVGQWEQSFYSMYPYAYIKVISAETFKPNVRASVLEDIRDSNYDAVIIAYSCFEMIKVGESIAIAEQKARLARIDYAISTAGRLGITRLYQKRALVEKTLAKLEKEEDKNSKEVCFEDLCINTLFVDEAHNFKNIKVETSMQYVRGMSHTGSRKAKNLMAKCKTVYANNGGRGVVFATGTPITNSMTDLYVMQQYLQQSELATLDLDSFDNWVSMFAEMVDECEVDVDVNAYRQVTRFSYFHNLPELVGLLGQVVDFHKVNEEDLPDIDDSEINKKVARSAQQKLEIANIANRIELIRGKLVDRREDNMLKVTVDGRKLALDVRLLNNNLSADKCSKTVACANNVYNIWCETRQQKGTQMVFSDIGTPKAEFNIYDELRCLLVQLGIPKVEIGFIHEATNEIEKTNLLDSMRAGKMRVLIGSTPKMGIGVNVQNRMVALHHLDVPWRPSDMTQREGRILRQGNRNEVVKIFRYITEGTFDAYSWQILESKQRFISQLLCGNIGIRDSAEIDDTVLTYAEVKALAIGNPLIKHRVETYNDFMKYRTLERQDLQHRQELIATLPIEEGRAERLRYRIAAVTADNERYTREFVAIKGGKTEIGQAIIDGVNGNLAGTVARDSVIMEYQGFKIVIPQQSSPAKKMVTISGNADYNIEVGDSGVGAIIRVDGYLKSLNEYIAKLTENAKILEDNIEIWHKE
ncbi:MAG: DEAD/DEAH box helicase family protein, partial [Bacillota bacterium]